jgi:bifunctional non-homologous end joining protein LigD
MNRPLDPYAAKRSFTKTPEPKPQIPAARSGCLLFVVQEHAARRLHYDFRLELDGVLKSWAVPKGPSLDVNQKRMAIEVEDHPFDYGSFEGAIPSKEYGAGKVIVWDCGAYSPDENSPFQEDREIAQAEVRAGLAAGKLSFSLRGTKLKGSFALVRTKTAKQWLLIKHKDAFASADDVIARNRSVLCDLPVAEVTPGLPRIPAERLAPLGPPSTMPAELVPMFAESADDPRTDPQWLYEPKLDGYRAVALIGAGKARLISRRGLDYSAFFPEILTELAAQGVSMILDGEIIALNAAGKPTFDAVQNRAQTKTAKELAQAQRDHPATFVCFDLLHFAGLDVCQGTYVERRRWLTQCLLPSNHVHLIHVSERAEELYAASLELGFEGILAKRKDSIYQPGRRSPSWLKIKAAHSADFVIGGFTQGRSERRLGALLLGFWQGGKLQYVGRAGSGFSPDTAEALRLELLPLAQKRCPFTTKPEVDRPVTWVEPVKVAEVRFEDATVAGQLRAPVFVRLREDIDAQSVTSAPQKRGVQQRKPATAPGPVAEVLRQLDTDAKQISLVVGDAQIRLTHLDREYWPAVGNEPAIAKREFLGYLAAVSPYMLPHLRDRALTMIRMPTGIGGERFYQKHADRETLPEYVATTEVFSEHKSEPHRYLMANNLATLLWLGQMGALEFHVAHSRVTPSPDCASQSTDFATSIESLKASVANYPDYLVFDLDPYIYSGKEAPGEEPELNANGFAMGKQVAFWLHDLLAEMRLNAVVKTSGKTGLHVFVPIDRQVTFDEARALCETVGRHLLQAHPKDITLEWAVVKRTGKIFIDYNMNVRWKTLNVAYSPRGVPGAPISMPLSWEELKHAEPMQFTMRNVLARLEKLGDRWHDALAAKQNLGRIFGAKGTG